MASPRVGGGGGRRRARARRGGDARSQWQRDSIRIAGPGGVPIHVSKARSAKALLHDDSLDDASAAASDDASPGAPPVSSRDVAAKVEALPPAKQRMVVRLLDRLAELELDGGDKTDVRSSLDLLHSLLASTAAASPAASPVASALSPPDAAAASPEASTPSPATSPASPSTASPAATPGTRWAPPPLVPLESTVNQAQLGEQRPGFNDVIECSHLTLELSAARRTPARIGLASLALLDATGTPLTILTDSQVATAGLAHADPLEELFGGGEWTAEADAGATITVAVPSLVPVSSVVVANVADPDLAVVGLRALWNGAVVWDMNVDLGATVAFTLDGSARGRAPLARSPPRTASSPPPSSAHSASPPAVEHHQVLLVIRSTHGHRTRLGLTGLELVDINGQQVAIAPSDVAVSGIDPATPGGDGGLSALVSGTVMTNDTGHMWEAWIEAGRPPHVHLEVAAKSTSALGSLVVYNYNASLKDSLKCVKDVEVWVDGELVWEGALKMAKGNAVFEYAQRISLVADPEGAEPAFAEPAFAEPEGAEPEGAEPEGAEPEGAEFEGAEFEGAEPEGAEPEGAERAESERAEADGGDAQSPRPATTPSVFTYPEGQTMMFNFKTTWGDPFYMGLAGIEVFAVGETKAMVLEPEWLAASPASLNELDGVDGDPRTVDKVVDGVVGGEDDTHMWLVPYTPGQDHTLRIQFPAPTRVRAIKVYNYNKSEDDSFRGVKTFELWIGRTAVPFAGDSYEWVVRKAGASGTPDGHVLDLDPRVRAGLAQATAAAAAALASAPPVHTAKTSFVVPPIIGGMVFELVLLSNWGDLYYMGVNGVRGWDASGQLVDLGRLAEDVRGSPESINVLDGVDGDGRTAAEALRLPATAAAPLGWLVPWNPGASTVARLKIVLPAPLFLARIDIINYSRTPARGARHVQLWVDGLLVASTAVPKGGTATIGAVQARPATGATSARSAREQAVTFTNDRVVVPGAEDGDAVSWNLRARVPEKRPATRLRSRPASSQRSASASRAKRRGGRGGPTRDVRRTKRPSRIPRLPRRAPPTDDAP